MIYPLPAGLKTQSISLVSGSIIPKTIVVVMNTTDAIEGSYKKNPFNFQHFGLEEIFLRVNGRAYPTFSLKPDFKAGTFNREYNWLYGEIGCIQSDRGLSITREGFSNGGFTCFPFSTSPDKCNNTHTHKAEYGTLSLELTWSAALTAPISILVYQSYDQMVSVTNKDAPFDIKYF